MARKRDLTSRLVATIPAVTAIAAGAISALQPENMEKIRTFLSNPLNVGVITVYAAVILAITTAILFQLVRSARISERQERATEPPAEPDRIEPDTPEPAPLSAQERALVERSRYLSSVRVAFTRNRRRMIDETERIQRNGFLNLMIGILFSVVALGILGYPLFATNATPAADWMHVVERFAPRLSVGILIQLIGFFFLRLYVAGEHELRYIHNEITNLDSRLISYNAAAANNDKAGMKDFIAQLARTERNFKLKKGERTIHSIDDAYNDVGEIIKEALKTKQTNASKE